MRIWISAAAAAALAAMLGACSGTLPAQSDAGAASGITVFGTVDSNITYTR